eukprot:COSAG02_NODE_4229_length_5609_cov_169.384574_3_plen_166_part_00
MADDEELVLKVAEAVQVLTAQDLIFDAVKAMWCASWSPQAVLARMAAKQDPRKLLPNIVLHRAPHCPRDGKAPSSAIPMLKGTAHTGPSAQLREGGGGVLLSVAAVGGAGDMSASQHVAPETLFVHGPALLEELSVGAPAPPLLQPRQLSGARLRWPRRRLFMAI